MHAVPFACKILLQFSYYRIFLSFAVSHPLKVRSNGDPVYGALVPAKGPRSWLPLQSSCFSCLRPWTRGQLHQDSHQASHVKRYSFALI